MPGAADATPLAMRLQKLHCLRMHSDPPAWALAAPRLAVLLATGPAVRSLPADAFITGEEVRDCGCDLAALMHPTTCSSKSGAGFIRRLSRFQP